MSVEQFEFHADRLGPLTILQLPELAGQTFVTESFVERARKAKLVGMNFVRVWQD